MTPIKVNFRNLQILERGDYDSGYKEGYKIGYETGYSVGFSDGAQNATEEYNQTLLTLTGTTQPTAEQAITEINATLADALTGKGVEAEATETTEGLARKVEQIEDWVATYATSISFANVGLYDEGALKHVPNMHLSNMNSCNGMFRANQAAQTVGDIYAPKATEAKDLFSYSYVRQIGRLVFPEVTTLHLAIGNCPYLERVEEVIAPKNTYYYQFAWHSPIKYIGGELDFTNVTYAGMFCNSSVLEQIGFVSGSIHVDLDLRSCGLLNDASLQSIKNGLADLTGQTQQTIQFHSAVLAKYTDDEIAEMVSKNWIVK